jgi:hypothetical protein
MKLALLALALLAAADAAVITVPLLKMPVDVHARQHHANRTQLLTMQPQDLWSNQDGVVPIINFMDAQVATCNHLNCSLPTASKSWTGPLSDQLALDFLNCAAGPNFLLNPAIYLQQPSPLCCCRCCCPAVLRHHRSGDPRAALLSGV